MLSILNSNLPIFSSNENRQVAQRLKTPFYRMSEAASSSESTTTEKTVLVEPAAEGPPVKAKRQLTEAQLEALKKGREKLAEKRRQAKEEESKKSEQESKEESDSDEEEVLPDASGAPFCTIM